MEQTLAQAGVQSPEFSNGRIRVARSAQDRELRWFLAAVTVVSVVALYYLQLDWLKLISRLPELGKTFGLLALLDFHDFGLTLEAFFADGGDNCAVNDLQRAAGAGTGRLWRTEPDEK